jgi:predicted small lipoprotein YifL
VLLALLLATGLLAGCGQKGDLYLPDEKPEDAARR